MKKPSFGNAKDNVKKKSFGWLASFKQLTSSLPCLPGVGGRSRHHKAGEGLPGVLSPSRSDQVPHASKSTLGL